MVRAYQIIVNSLIKLEMNYQSMKLKRGALQMTISSDRRHSYSQNTKLINQSPKKDKNNKTIYFGQCGNKQRYSEQIDNKYSPYMKYRYNHKESLKYYRQQDNITRLNTQQIQGFSPINNTIQISIIQHLQNDDPLTANFPKNNQMRHIFNKKYLRNTIDFYQYKIKDAQTIKHNIKNPQQYLKEIFTVRSIKTVQKKRSTEPRHRQSNTPILRKGRVSSPKYRCQNDPKRIRPWSTSRNLNKSGIYQSQMICNLVQPSQIL